MSAHAIPPTPPSPPSPPGSTTPASAGGAGRTGAGFDELRDHEFDGIHEFDNPLPGWWLGIFYVTVAISLIYVPWKHWPGSARGQESLYVAEQAEALRRYGPRKSGWDEEELRLHYAGGEWQGRGEDIFIASCAPCHRKDGGGNIGPNMTDDHYLHGGRLADIARTITEGVPAKGMLSWKRDLKRDQIRDVACYVRSLRGRQIDRPKGPQGVEVDHDGAPLGQAKPPQPAGSPAPGEPPR